MTTAAAILADPPLGSRSSPAKIVIALDDRQEQNRCSVKTRWWRSRPWVQVIQESKATRSKEVETMYNVESGNQAEAESRG